MKRSAVRMRGIGAMDDAAPPNGGAINPSYRQTARRDVWRRKARRRPGRPEMRPRHRGRFNGSVTRRGADNGILGAYTLARPRGTTTRGGRQFPLALGKFLSKKQRIG